MPTDYDAPRVSDLEVSTDEPVEELKAHGNNPQSATADVEVTDTAESFELPGADLSGEELEVRVLPKQEDEFTCMGCFLVQHRTSLADAERVLCEDCV